MRKLIKVTKADIKAGCRENPFSCPVVLALSRIFDGSRVSVGRFITVYRDDGSFSSDLGCPRSVNRFINAFDSNKKVKPFNFYVDL